MESAMTLATLYSYPLWEDCLIRFGPGIVMFGTLVAWVLFDHRWARVTYWVILVAGIAYYGHLAITGGWKEIIPQGPNDSVYDPRWGIRLAAKLVAWGVMLLSVSALLWRRWARCKLGLADDPACP